MTEIEFAPFPKIARYKRDIVVTEKIDGTNAQVIIAEDGQIAAGSRSRLITPGKSTDNHGFAGWVDENKDELMKLGPGRHFGEWFGGSIQCGYGLKEKRFALFNVGRWNDENKPACCHVVPVLYDGPMSDAEIDGAFERLGKHGSLAAPGFMRPEGIIIYHTASRTLFKRTFEKDDEGKWAMKTAAE